MRRGVWPEIAETGVPELRTAPTRVIPTYSAPSKIWQRVPLWKGSPFGVLFPIAVATDRNPEEWVSRLRQKDELSILSARCL
jgi:hypothetical protein